MNIGNYNTFKTDTALKMIKISVAAFDLRRTVQKVSRKAQKIFGLFRTYGLNEPFHALICSGNEKI